jgi:hypothetical protein
MPSDILGAAMAGDVAAMRRQAGMLWARGARWASNAAVPRGWFIYLLSWPLVIAGMLHLAGGSLGGFLSAGIGFVLLVAAARFIRRAAVDLKLAPTRRFTRTTRLPLGMLAVGFVGIGTALAAIFAAGNGVIAGGIQGLIAAAGCYLLYGQVVKPTTPRPAVARTDGRRLDKTLAAAEERIIAIERAAIETENVELGARLRRITGEARTILDLVAKRPAALGQMRRFFNVHLDGAHRIAVRYARTHRWSANGELESNYRHLLIQIEASFVAQRRRLVNAEGADLDVLIEVLRKQLREEGFA